MAAGLRGGGEEVVGLGLENQTVPQVSAAAISGDGRTVAFLAHGANAADLALPAGADPQTTGAIFVRDRLTGATVWVQLPDLGIPASHHRLRNLALSADGRRLAAGLTLPLPEYDDITSPEGVLLATLAADAAPVTHVVRPEDLVGDEPGVEGFALSGDGKVLAVNAADGDERALLRFDAASGDRLPGERALTQAQHTAWFPHLDQAGRRTAFGGAGAGVVVADLVTGPSADLTLAASAKVPYVSGDTDFSSEDLPSAARLSADGSTVAFRRAGAVWTQAAQAGRAPRAGQPRSGRPDRRPRPRRAGDPSGLRERVRAERERRRAGLPVREHRVHRAPHGRAAAPPTCSAPSPPTPPCPPGRRTPR